MATNKIGFKPISSIGEQPVQVEPQASSSFTPIEKVKPAKQEAPKSNAALGSIRSALQGMTLGWSDEIGLGIAAAMAKAAGDEKDFSQIYDEMKKSYDTEQGQFKKEHPYLSTASELAGGLATGGVGATKTAALQGGKRVAAMAAQGAGYGGITGAGTAEEGQRLEAGLTGLATGAAFGGGMGTLEKAASGVVSRLAQRKAANVVKDETLAAAQKAGYVVPPSMGESGFTMRLLEGLSGKHKTSQLAGIKNQRVTDKLARRTLGISDDVPLTTDSMRNIRKEAFDAGYTPVSNAGEIAVDKFYAKELKNVFNKYQGAARSFPGAAKADIADMIEGFKVDKFDSGDAIQAIQMLRDTASDAYRTGNTRLGKASREVASAIEDQIERGLVKQGAAGSTMLQNFRNSRQLMAKSHTVEDALVEGLGSVDARKLASKLKRNKNLTGELKTIAKFGSAFSDVTGVPKAGHANPLTGMDFGYGGLAAMANPAVPAMVLAPAAARVGSRYAMLSQPYQKMLQNPQYRNRLAEVAANKNITGPMANLLAIQSQQ